MMYAFPIAREIKTESPFYFTEKIVLPYNGEEFQELSQKLFEKMRSLGVWTQDFEQRFDCFYVFDQKTHDLLINVESIEPGSASNEAAIRTILEALKDRVIEPPAPPIPEFVRLVDDVRELLGRRGADVIGEYEGKTVCWVQTHHELEPFRLEWLGHHWVLTMDSGFDFVKLNDLIMIGNHTTITNHILGLSD